MVGHPKHNKDSDFSVFYKTLPETERHFSLYDFIKVFIYGDIVHLMSFTPSGLGRHISLDLDSSFDDPKERAKFGGDPVKTAMLVQSLRRFPYIVSLPLIISLTVIIASLAKLSIPFIRRLSNLTPALVNQRVKREAIDNVTAIPNELSRMGGVLARGLEGVEFMALQSADQQEGYSFPSKRSTKFLTYHERKARLALAEVDLLGERIADWMRNFVNLLPSVGNCVGQVIGCHIRAAALLGNCPLFAPLTSCINVVGNAVRVLANSFNTPSR